MIDLLIQDGILFKPYLLPWKPDGWGSKPKGWTAYRCERVERHVARILEAKPNMPPTLALRSAEVQAGKELHAETRKPWRGWVPIIASRDKKLSRAYRQLFVELNPDAEEIALRRKYELVVYPVWPPDGEYVYDKGKMRKKETTAEAV